MSYHESKDDNHQGWKSSSLQQQQQQPPPPPEDEDDNDEGKLQYYIYKLYIQYNKLIIKKIKIKFI